MPVEFSTMDSEFRIHFEHALAADTARGFYGVMNFSHAKFVSERPVFEATMMEFDAIAGRFFVASWDGCLCFYCESNNGDGGLLLPLQNTK